MTIHRVDAVVLALNHLLLVGRTTTDEEATEVEISLPSARLLAPVQARLRFEAAEPKSRRKASVDAVGFILACPLGFEFAKQVSAVPLLSAILRSNGRTVGSGTLAVSSLLSPEVEAYADALRLMSVESAASHPLFFRILASILDSEHKSPTVATHLDHHLVVPETAFIAAGWADGVGEHSVAFILDEFRLVVNPERVLTRPGENTPSGSRLSRFTCVDTIVGACTELRLAAASGTSIRWSQLMELRNQGTPRALMQIASGTLTYEQALYLISSSDVLQTVVRARIEPQTTEVLAEDCDRGRAPDLSIIIPFYGDDFFLLDHLESQRRTGASAEWIFVCDDPALLPSMMDQWRVRGTGGKSSRLISLSENVGYARANNIGFARARADIVALMNSDIYWRSLAPLEYGARLLREDPSIGVVGFTLRYEDGTLQHGGMTLKPFPDHDDLLHWDHPGKGLPDGDTGNSIGVREVEAVTGALMLVRRKDFAGGVFDEGYVGGDYEDGDLCLAMRARGKRIVLVECQGLFHLERQSIRSQSAHDLFTAMNCVRFNRKWAADGLPRFDNQGEGRSPETRPENSQSRLATSRGTHDSTPDLVTSECAIHAHIFYSDLADEILSYLDAKHLSEIDTYITVVDDDSLKRVAGSLELIGRRNIRVTRVPNRGRDLAPLFLHNQPLFQRYKYICHLHSKKSPHTNFGDEWRQYLFRGCVGDATTVADVLSRFAADPNLAVAFPDNFPKIAPFTRFEFNADHIDAFLKRLNSDWRYQRTEFPAGSMCWIRTAAFLPVIGKMPKFDEIEVEAGQIDRTWAHAMERCLTLIPTLSGFTFCSYPAGGEAQ